jgi:hypothetical protein
MDSIESLDVPPFTLPVSHFRSPQAQRARRAQFFPVDIFNRTGFRQTTVPPMRTLPTLHPKTNRLAVHFHRLLCQLS